MANPIVIDLSHWNATPDWKTLYANGTMGVIHKATEGTGYVDNTYGQRVNAARQAGLWWASYHFLKHGSIQQQMEWYVQRAGIQKGGRAIIDYEDAACTLTDLEQAVTLLFDRYGCEVTVYGSSHLVESINGKPNELLSRTSLWQARYSTSQPNVPPPWKTWSMWQYTDKAKVVGCPEPVDANKWNGETANLALWFNGAQEPLPPPQPSDQVVNITITAPAGVSVVVNGEQLELPLG